MASPRRMDILQSNLLRAFLPQVAVAILLLAIRLPLQQMDIHHPLPGDRFLLSLRQVRLEEVVPLLLPVPQELQEPPVKLVVKEVQVYFFSESIRSVQSIEKRKIICNLVIKVLKTISIIHHIFIILTSSVARP